jgi:hypothetical protein
MNLFLGILQVLLRVYRMCLAWLTRRRTYRLAYVTEEPDRLDRRTVYAVGEGGHLWHVTFLCPCGCSAVISLNLLPDDSPRWHLSTENGRPTLTPSVHRKIGCGSHFFLRNGLCVWCGR